jgi:hypothetical protein
MAGKEAILPEAGRETCFLYRVEFRNHLNLLGEWEGQKPTRNSESTRMVKRCSLPE